MATPEQINENKRRLAYLRSLGYRTVPQDGSWGPWLENLWRKATTREKQYSVSPLGLLLRGLDTLTGNTTYRIEHPEGEIRQAPEKRSSNLASAGIVATTASRVNPYGVMSAVPLAIGSSLVLGNGPEIMRSVSDAGRSIKSSVQSLIDGVVTRFDSIEDREDPSIPTTSSTSSPSSVSTPDPQKDEQPDSDKKNRSIRDLLWRRSGKSSSGRLSKLKPSRATVENYGVRLPLYTGVAAPIVDLGLNIVGRAYTPDSTSYTMKFPVTKARFAFEKGVLGLIGDAYKEPSSKEPSSNDATLTDSTALPAGFRPIQGVNDSTGQIVVPSTTGKPDSVITIEPLIRNRFGRGNNQNQ